MVVFLNERRLLMLMLMLMWVECEENVITSSTTTLHSGMTMILNFVTKSLISSSWSCSMCVCWEFATIGWKIWTVILLYHFGNFSRQFISGISSWQMLLLVVVCNFSCGHYFSILKKTWIWVVQMPIRQPLQKVWQQKP